MSLGRFIARFNGCLLMDSAIENGPWLWQSNQFTTGYSKFFQFCDAVEVLDSTREDLQTLTTVECRAR